MSDAAARMLIALAQHCNGDDDDYVVWPSTARLCRVTGFRERKAQRALKELRTHPRAPVRRIVLADRATPAYEIVVRGGAAGVVAGVTADAKADKSDGALKEAELFPLNSTGKEGSEREAVCDDSLSNSHALLGAHAVHQPVAKEWLAESEGHTNIPLTATTASSVPAAIVSRTSTDSGKVAAIDKSSGALRVGGTTSSAPAPEECGRLSEREARLERVFRAWQQARGESGTRLWPEEAAALERVLEHLPVEDLVDAMRGTQVAPSELLGRTPGRTFLRDGIWVTEQVAQRYNRLVDVLRFPDKLERLRDAYRRARSREEAEARAAAARAAEIERWRARDTTEREVRGELAERSSEVVLGELQESKAEQGRETGDRSGVSASTSQGRELEPQADPAPGLVRGVALIRETLRRAGVLV